MSERKSGVQEPTAEYFFVGVGEGDMDAVLVAADFFGAGSDLP
ncbi:hypothetical protein ACIF8T_34785 [Streptomyces sp. NPDC085946]